MSDLPAAGWYPDPERPGAQRWWDGRTWAPSGAVPDDAPPPPPPPQGAPPPGAPVAPSAPTKTDGVAIASLVLALVWLVGIGSVLGIVLGIVALRRIRAAAGQSGGRGLAIAGIVIGALGLAATLLIGVLVVGPLGEAFDCAFDNPDATPEELERCLEERLGW